MIYINFANSNDVRSFRIIKKTILQQRPLGARALKPSSEMSKMTKYEKEGFKLQFLSYFGLSISLEHQKYSFKTNYSVESQFEVPQ